MTAGPTLLIGYGNPARGDDGLGPAFAQRIAARALPGLTVDIDFQLTVDHALEISRHRRVIFADAAIGCDTPFQFRELQAATPRSLGSHTVTPEAAVALCGLLFQATPRAFILGISGQEFGAIKEGLSGLAQQNLDLAEADFLRWYDDSAARVPPPPLVPAGQSQNAARRSEAAEKVCGRAGH